MFGSGTGTVIEQTPDIIITKDLNVIPNPPILAGNEFSVSFVVKNQDTTETIEPLTAKLYNWGVCTLGDLESFGWTKGTSYYTKEMTMFPQQEELIEFPFTAPENSKIGSIETDCQIKWLFEYDYNSRSQDDFTVISKDRITELSRAGEIWQGENMAQYVGAGPIKLYFNWKTPMPVQVGSSIQFSIQAIDKGVGIYSEIISPDTLAKIIPPATEAEKVCPTCGLYIRVPYEWVKGKYYNDVKDACTGNFVLNTNPAGIVGTDVEEMPIESLEDTNIIQIVSKDGYVEYYNLKNIPFIKRETPEIICRFTAPDLGEGVPERSYFVSAEITDYTYKLTGEKAVHIKPTV